MARLFYSTMLCILFNLSLGASLQNSQKCEEGAWCKMKLDGKAYNYKMTNGLRMYEGDIALPDIDDSDLRRRLSPASNTFDKLWPNSKIPYVIQDAVLEQTVNQAINVYHSKTDIKWVKRVNEDIYVVFKFDPNPKGSTYTEGFGRPAQGIQNVVIASWCNYWQCLAHEMGHVVGLLHTHTREDRDQYLEIMWDNIIDDDKPQFEKHLAETDDCLSFDYNSIMLYRNNGDSKNGENTMIAINPRGAVFGKQEDVSSLDAQCINNLYSKCMVRLFSEDNFAGKEFSPFGIGIYHLNDLLAIKDFEDNTVSSIKVRVSPHTKCRVWLYDSNQVGGSGWYAPYPFDNSASSNVKEYSYTLDQLQKNVDTEFDGDAEFINNQVSALLIEEFV